MTLARVGTRREMLGDEVYRWMIRKSPTSCQGAFASSMVVAIEKCMDAPGTVLLVDLVVRRPDNWVAPHQTALKPAAVRSIIAEALRAGWKPDEPGGAFRYQFPLIKDAP